MATIKSFTDLEQSRKLAEILPTESADMSWVSNGLGKPFARTIPIKGDPEELCACWSLAALLKVISNIFKYNLDYNGISFILTVGDFEVSNTTAVDACFKMILKLKENSLL